MRANSACLQALLQHIIVSHCDYDNQQHLESFLSWPWLCGSIFVTFIVIFYLCSFRLDGETCQFLFLFPFPLVHLQFVHYAYVLFCAEFFCAHLIMLKNHFILFRVICLFQYLDFSSVLLLLLLSREHVVFLFCILSFLTWLFILIKFAWLMRSFTMRGHLSLP